jgi:AcrR family transcriptional regulator
MPAVHTPRRGHRRELTARQSALFDGLLRLFLAEGFARFTIEDLAARMRCSKSTLYALAPSKEQLATRVVGHFFSRAAARIERRIADTTDAKARIGAYLSGVTDELAPASAEFISDVADFPPTRAIYENNAQAAASRIKTFISEGVASGAFRDVHAGLIAEMAGLLIEGIQSGVIGQRAGVSDAEAFTALAELLLGGLASG